MRRIKHSLASAAGTLLLALFSLALAGCGDESAGTTTETTNGIVVASGAVSRLDGTPARGALVRLIDDERWLERTSAGLSPAIDSVLADSAGRFELRGKTGRANVQVDDGDLAALVRGIVPADTAVELEIALDSAGTLKGSVADRADLADGALFLLSGTAYGVSISDDGFLFGNVAKGNYALVTAAASTDGETLHSVASVGVKPGETKEKDFDALDAARLMVDDFDDEEDLTTLGRVIGAGWRYHGTDAPSKASRSLVPEGAWSGRSLRGDFELAESDSAAWAVMGTFFGDYGESFDLRGLQAVEFMAKGHGVYEISLFSEALNADSTNDDHFAVDFVLDSADGWRKIRVEAADFRLRADTPDRRPDDFPFDAALEKAGAVRFALRRSSGNAPGKYVLLVDEIVLVGVPLERFAR